MCSSELVGSCSFLMNVTAFLKSGKSFQIDSYVVFQEMEEKVVWQMFNLDLSGYFNNGCINKYLCCPVRSVVRALDFHCSVLSSVLGVGWLCLEAVQGSFSWISDT